MFLKQLSVFALLGLGTVRIALAEFQTLFPAACGVGQTVEVRATGVDSAAVWWFSADGIEVEHIDKDRFCFTVAAEEKLGPVDVWVATGNRLEGPRRFFITDRLVQVEDETTEPQRVSAPGWLDGRLDRAADEDRYQFDVPPGILTIEVQSESLGGRVRPAFTLLDPLGREVAYGNSHSAEPTCSIPIKAAGTYEVVVYDRAYQQNQPAHYRLILSTDAMICGVEQPVIPGEQPAPPTLITDRIAGQSPSSTFERQLLGGPEWQACVAGQRPAIRGTSVEFPVLQYQVSGLAGRVSLRRVAQEVTVESNQLKDDQASDDRSSPSNQPLQLPAVVAAHFERANDVDWYTFTARKGVTYDLEVIGERWGQWMDVELLVCDPDRKVLLELKDTVAPKGLPATIPLASLDPAGSWKSDRDGEVLVGVRDLYGGSVYGFHRPYELHVREQEPRATVVILPADDKKQIGWSVAPGGEFELPLAIIRRGGCQRAVRIGPVGSDVWSSEPTVIEGKAATGKIKIQVAQEVSPGFHELRLSAWLVEGEQPQGSEKPEQALDLPVRMLATLHTGTATPSRMVTRLPILVTEVK